MDQATHGDDGVGEVEEGVDDGDPALVAAGGWGVTFLEWGKRIRAELDL